MPNRKDVTSPPPLPDNFAEHPQSIGDLRAARSHIASDWTPRDVLIDTLRDIDSGAINPDALILMYRDQLKDGRHGTGFSVASKCKFVTMGLFGWAKELFVRSNGIEPGTHLLLVGAVAYAAKYLNIIEAIV